MKFGVSLPTFTPDVARPMDVARRAAAAGADAVFAPDHVFPPGAPERSAIEPFTLLSAVAAANPGLGVGVLVTRAGVQPTGILAKQGAALDHLSGGRAILGLGMGDRYARAEHEAMGIAFPPVQDRTVTLEETARALRALFAGRPWPGGTRVGALAGPLLPPGAPQVWVGGISDRALGVAARAADAWNGWGLDAEGFASRAKVLEELADAAGRDSGGVVPTWGGITLVGEDAGDLARLERDRAAKDLPMGIWRGTVEDLRTFADALAAAGCAWLVCLAAGPTDRLELIARTLRER